MRVAIQSEGELDERKSKKMKGNENNFAFICFQEFFGIGSQRVTADSNKKIAPF
jgi:hypothetical protein